MKQTTKWIVGFLVFGITAVATLATIHIASAYYGFYQYTFGWPESECTLGYNYYQFVNYYTCDDGCEYYPITSNALTGYYCGTEQYSYDYGDDVEKFWEGNCSNFDSYSDGNLIYCWDNGCWAFVDDWEWYCFSYPPTSFEYDFETNSACEEGYNSYTFTPYYYCEDGCYYYNRTFSQGINCVNAGSVNYEYGGYSFWDEVCVNYDYYWSYIYCQDDECYYYKDGTYSCDDGDSGDYSTSNDEGVYYGDDETVTNYSDVEPTNPYITAINYLSENGVIQGYSDGTYKPNADVNRVEALKIIFATLSNILGLYDIDTSNLYITSNMHFSDIEDGAWYIPYVQQAYLLGIVQGYSDGTYKPAQTINKVEILKIVIQAFDLENMLADTVTETLYPDVDINAWYAPYVQLAYELGIFYDLDLTDNFYPADNMRRGEIADLVYRFVDAVYFAQ